MIGSLLLVFFLIGELEMMIVSSGYNLKLNWLTGAPSIETRCELNNDFTEFLDWFLKVSRRNSKSSHSLVTLYCLMLL